MATLILTLFGLRRNAVAANRDLLSARRQSAVRERTSFGVDPQIEAEMLVTVLGKIEVHSITL